jgi:hypothetical protein
LIERPERQVIGVCMRQQDCIDPRQIRDGNSRLADTRKKPTECLIEVRIGE